MPPQIDKVIPVADNVNNEQLLPLDEQQKIIRTQKYLFIIVFIQWLAFFITLGVGIYSLLFRNSADISNGFQSLLPIIGLIIFYTFGLLVIYKKNRIGLIIFASIGLILFICMCVLFGYILLVITALSIGFGGSSSRTLEFSVFYGVLFLIMAFVAILTLKLSFDLAKWLKRNDYSTV